ncbi:MAG: TolC family protein [Candidatus Goldbacteria bacterium]|nr:TolC family protein [Candidatus Goldiibacteriota bacterium]
MKTKNIIKLFLVLIITAAFNAGVFAEDTAVLKLSFDDFSKLCAENNREFKMAKLDKEIAQARLGQAAASFGPVISLEGGYQAVYNTFSVVPVRPWYAAQVSLQQPVFTFGKTLFGFKIAEEAYRIASVNFKKAEEKLNLDVISSYYGALITKELMNAGKQSLKSNEEYLKITQAKYKSGQASNFEVLQAQVQYANSRPDARKAEDNYMLSMQMLKNTAGISLDREVELTGEPGYSKLELTAEEIKQKFRKGSDDGDLINSAAKIAEYKKYLAGSMFLPNIAIAANYTYMSADSAFHTEKSYWFGMWDVMVGVQWTFFNGFKNVYEFKQAAAEEEKQQLVKDNTVNLLEIQLEQLYTGMQESAEVIEAAGDLIKQAEEGFRIASESYKNGLIQSVDLMNAEIGLLKAKTNYYNALNNYLTSMQKLKNFIE